MFIFVTLAKTFSEQGLKHDSKVAFYCYNGPEYLEGQFAAFKIRAIPANVNYRYLDEELAYILNNADAEVILFDSSLTGRVESVRSRCPKLKVFIRIGEGVPEDELPPVRQRVLLPAIATQNKIANANSAAPIFDLQSMTASIG